MLDTLCWILLGGPAVVWFLWGCIIALHLVREFRGMWDGTLRAPPRPEEYSPEAQRWMARARTHRHVVFVMILWVIVVAETVCHNAHLGR